MEAAISSIKIDAVLAKIGQNWSYLQKLKILGFYTLAETIFIITQDLNKTLALPSLPNTFI